MRRSALGITSVFLAACMTGGVEPTASTAPPTSMPTPSSEQATPSVSSVQTASPAIDAPFRITLQLLEPCDPAPDARCVGVAELRGPVSFEGRLILGPTEAGGQEFELDASMPHRLPAGEYELQVTVFREVGDDLVATSLPPTDVEFTVADLGRGLIANGYVDSERVFIEMLSRPLELFEE